MKNPIYILIPVHNRKSITLTCLEHLQQQGALDRYHVVVIDDASTDGTSDAIAQRYPDVTILAGDGNLWWTGAIVKGMKFAMEQGARYLIWLNDDTLPEEQTLEKLITACIDNPRTIASAQCYEDETFQKGSFGGHRVNQQKLYSECNTTGLGQQTVYDGLNGNLVCLSRSVVDCLGYPNQRWMPHGWADLIYTFESKKSGFLPTVIGDARAVCPMNPIYKSWFEGPISIGQRWATLLTPKSHMYPPCHFYGNFKLYGVRGIIPILREYQRLVLVTALILLVPKSMVQAIRNYVRTQKQADRPETQLERQHRLIAQTHR